MKLPGSVKWIGLALVGLAIAAGVALAASALTSQQIGISSESISAGDSLAPHSRSHSGKGGGEQTTSPTTPETTPTEPTTTEPETTPVEPEPEPEEGDDHGGGGGDNGGHGSDD